MTPDPDKMEIWKVQFLYQYFGWTREEFEQYAARRMLRRRDRASANRDTACYIECPVCRQQIPAPSGVTGICVRCNLMVWASGNKMTLKQIDEVKNDTRRT